MSYDPLIHTTVTATMAALQRHVSRGSHWYVAGTVPAERALALAARFDERYHLGMTVAQRDHARRRGRAVFRLVMWPLADQTSLEWWLLRSDGDHPLLSMERWRDARRDRIRWPWMYELLRMPVDGALRAKYLRSDGRKAINPVTWTWRICRDEMDAMRASIRHWSQVHDDRLPALIRSLHAAPGFRGIRQDVWRLYRYVERQHAKRQRAAPPIPDSIRWITARRSATVPLSTLVRRRQQGRATWFPARVAAADTETLCPPDEQANAVTPTP